MTKPNIAFVITLSEVGGAQTWVKDQVEIVLQSNNFNEVHLITSSEGWLTNTLPSCVKIHIVPEIKNKISFSAIYQLYNIFRLNKVKVAISNSANAGVYSRLAGIICSNTKQIYVSHGWSAIYNGGRFKKLYLLIENILGNYFSEKILCVSYCDEKKACFEVGIKKSKILTIRNAVNRIYPLNLQTHIINPEILKLAFIGRIAKPKRQDLTIEAISSLEDICSLDIIGGGNKLNLPIDCRNIRLIGEVESFDNYQNYDALILISDSEGLPMVALEAGINALPMILSNVGGCPEVIKNNGIIVNNDLNNIKKAILEIHSNYAEYKNAALIKIDEFDLKTTKAKYIKMYLGLI